jgi:hypothetical protein
MDETYMLMGLKFILRCNLGDLGLFTKKILKRTTDK